MPEPVVYSEVKFKRGPKGDTAGTAPPSKVEISEEEVVYSDVVISKTDATNQQGPTKFVPDESSPTERSKGKGRYAHLRLVVVVLCILILTLGLAIGLSLYLTNTKGKPEEETQKPATEHTEVNRHTTNTQINPTSEERKDSVTDSSAEWKLYEKHCYFFSNVKQTWATSKEECVRMKSHLAIINNETEQIFLMTELSRIMTEEEDKFWIGLNDIDKEGEWLWVDNTPLSGPTFWINSEPDDWQGQKEDQYPDGEDCVRIGEKRFDSAKPNGWVDTSCHRMMKFICETATCS
ncbi:hypothetical protein ACEWY4_024180 [Coilia grayii]|uniref:C-type lectin domain-containing protein n=1 Tax=Coilia grayii TaxID=363190 RepID=A0ABD1IZM4_9TELE